MEERRREEAPPLAGGDEAVHLRKNEGVSQQAFLLPWPALRPRGKGAGNAAAARALAPQARKRPLESACIAKEPALRPSRTSVHLLPLSPIFDPDLSHRAGAVSGFRRSSLKATRCAGARRVQSAPWSSDIVDVCNLRYGPCCCDCVECMGG